MSIVAGLGTIGLATTAVSQYVDAEPVHEVAAVATTSPDPARRQPVTIDVADEASEPAPVAAPDVEEAVPAEAPAPQAPVAPAPSPAPAAKRAPAPAPAPAPSLAATAPAPAPTPAPPPPPPPTVAQRGAEALALISYPWQALGYTVNFEGENPGLLGKANCGTKQIYVYVRPTQTIRQIAFVTAFELGHAVDCGFMTDAERAEWAGIRGFPAGWTWFPGCLCTEDNFGSGDISMVFATWLVPGSGYRWRSNLAPQPSGEQLNQLMPYLRPVG